MNFTNEAINYEKIRSELSKLGSTHNFDEQHLLRIQLLLLDNPQLINNQIILELGPGHGHFSRIMSLMNAKQVVALEGHIDHFNKFEERRKKDGIVDSKIKLIHGYYNEISERFKNEYLDTIFFAGSFYHIHNHFDFLKTIYNLKASNLILETATLDPRIELKVVEYLSEKTSNIWNAANQDGSPAVVGIPSQSAVEFFLSHAGWSITKKYDYEKYKIPGSIKSIERGFHVGYVCKKN